MTGTLTTTTNEKYPTILMVRRFKDDKELRKLLFLFKGWNVVLTVRFDSDMDRIVKIVAQYRKLKTGK